MADDGNHKQKKVKEMAGLAQRLAGKLVDAANDPDGDARRAAAEDEADRRQELILDAYHAARKPAQPLVGTPLRDLAALRDHLRAAGGDVTAHGAGLRVAGDPPVDVDWVAEHRQVRLRITPALHVAADHKAAIAAVVADGNAQTGIAVWRTEPHLLAELTVPCSPDGSVSSAEVDRAVRILRTTVARDAAALRKAAGG
jgi:hypothetical protein